MILLNKPSTSKEKQTAKKKRVTVTAESGSESGSKSGSDYSDLIDCESDESVEDMQQSEDDSNLDGALHVGMHVIINYEQELFPGFCQINMFECLVWQKEVQEVQYGSGQVGKTIMYISNVRYSTKKYHTECYAWHSTECGISCTRT